MGEGKQLGTVTPYLKKTPKVYKFYSFVPCILIVVAILKRARNSNSFRHFFSLSFSLNAQKHVVSYEQCFSVNELNSEIYTEAFTGPPQTSNMKRSAAIING